MGTRGKRGEEPVETYTVPTTAVSPAFADIRHRQPMILEDLDLDPASPASRPIEIAGGAYEGPFDRRPDRRAVNDARNEAPELTHPVAG